MKQRMALTSNLKPCIMPNNPRSQMTRVGRQPCLQFQWASLTTPRHDVRVQRA